jgi:phosphinothricin acetyltransferase
MTWTLRAARLDDLPTIAAIHDAAIQHTIAIFRADPLSASERDAWNAAHTAPHRLRVCIEGDRVCGFAGLRPYDESLPGYDGTEWLSVYVAEGDRGRGIGRALMTDLIEAARAAGLHHVLSRIALPNEASVGLHHAFGFREVGVMRGIGRKFGRVVDVLHLQYSLDPPVTEW